MAASHRDEFTVLSAQHSGELEERQQRHEQFRLEWHEALNQRLDDAKRESAAAEEAREQAAVLEQRVAESGDVLRETQANFQKDRLVLEETLQLRIHQLSAQLDAEQLKHSCVLKEREAELVADFAHRDEELARNREEMAAMAASHRDEFTVLSAQHSGELEERQQRHEQFRLEWHEALNQRLDDAKRESAAAEEAREQAAVLEQRVAESGDVLRETQANFQKDRLVLEETLQLRIHQLSTQVDAEQLKHSCDLKELEARYHEALQASSRDAAERVSKAEADLVSARAETRRLSDLLAEELQANRTQELDASPGSGHPLDSRPERIVLKLFRLLFELKFASTAEEEVLKLVEKAATRAPCNMPGKRPELVREVRGCLASRSDFDVRRAFRKFDVKRKGAITAVNFHDVMRQLLPQLGREVLGHVYYLMDSGCRQNRPATARHHRTSPVNPCGTAGGARVISPRAQEQASAGRRASMVALGNIRGGRRPETLMSSQGSLTPGVTTRSARGEGGSFTPGTPGRDADGGDKSPSMGGTRRFDGAISEEEFVNMFTDPRLLMG